MEGELRDRRLRKALRMIGRGGKTGILTLQGRDEIIAFSFLAGGIVGADALNQSLEAGLGEVLAKQRLVDPHEFALLAAEHEAGGGRVVDLLVERSVLSRQQLLENLRLHTYRLCVEALSWREGEYRFYQGDEVAFEEGFQPIGVGELLIRSTRELGTAGPLSGRIPELYEIYVRGPGAFAESEDEITDGIGGEDISHRALGLLDGKKTLAEVAEAAGLAPYEVQDLAHEWGEAGVIDKIGERQTAGESPIPAETSAAALSYVDLKSSADPSPVDEIELPLPEPGREHLDTPEPPVAIEPDVASRVPEGVVRWLNRVFGLAVLVAALTVLILGPSRILLPFPWQGALREGLRGGQRTVQRLKIERGAHTFFLLFGRYPESLDDLEPKGLIRSVDRELSAGERWRITASPASFVLRTERSERTDATDEASWTSSVVG
ncbi:MAG: DUF4388 domain-containing protein, partial [Acidobacteriota bacterium]|nr:DUF4388 domain-containing protein [Acidobacteriota bacterium]